MTRDLYQEVTDRIIEQLEQGVIPWRKPWTGVRSGAISHTTGRAYSILNQMLLRKPGEYLTFNQCKAEGGRVKKGAKAHFVVFWKVYRKQKADANGAPLFDSDGKPVMAGYPVLRYFNVFHIDDCEGITPKWADRLNDLESIPTADTVVNDYVARSGLTLVIRASNEAYYSPVTDSVHVPMLEQYDTAAEFYSTLFHELTHSTGHKTRLDRFPADLLQAAFGSESYSKEELVAEIGSACILNELGIESPETFGNSAAYIAGWLKALKDDRRLIVSAAARASRAVALILDRETAEADGD